jgi:hypothetical protein
MKRIWKLAGADEPDVTCLALFGGLVLAVCALFVAVLDVVRPEAAEEIDLSMSTLLAFSGALGSFLALRGNTYDDTRDGSWVTKITREGRAAVVILAASVVVAVGKEILGARHAQSASIAQQMRLAANSKLAIDSIRGRLSAVGVDLSAFIQQSGANISAEESVRLQAISNQLTGVGDSAAVSANRIVQHFELLSMNTDGLLTQLVGYSGHLSAQAGEALAGIESSRDEIRSVQGGIESVDTLLHSYQESSNSAIGGARDAQVAVRVSVDSMREVLTAVQGAIANEALLQAELNRITGESGMLRGRVTQLQEDFAAERARHDSARTELASARTQLAGVRTELAAERQQRSNVPQQP